MKSKKTINILIIEDNRLLRDGISVMINKQPDMKVVASISDSDSSLSRIFTLNPDVVLIDLGLRSQNSLDTVKAVSKESPNIKIIVMDLLPEQGDIVNFIKAGASGFILKDAVVNDFLKTIRSVANGEKIIPQNMTDSLFSQIIEIALNDTKKFDIHESIVMTKRERQVIELIADGLTNKEIGQTLNLSPYTVKSHVHNILEKMALHTRLQIANYAFSNKDSKDPSHSTSKMHN